jgi:catechol 2,3-dioxygenase
MGVVDLTVSDLPLMRDFYEGVIGLDVLSEGEDRVELGADGSAVISLTLDAELTNADPTAAGLYHSAILYPDEAGLAAALASVAQAAPETYQGSADHLVSLAFYLADPEGNGVELYVDRPADEWEWVDGRVTMGAEPLDPNQFINEHFAAESSGSATVGHVHLRVGELDAAETFYVDVLGFDITADAPGALFLSAGGYHHHLAVNTWNSLDASERMPSLGLGSFTVVLANSAEMEAASDRIAGAGLAVTTINGGVAVDDPWGNTVHLLVG